MAAAAALEVKQGDTYTVWTALLSNADGWLDVSAATLIKLVGKIQNGATLLGPVTMTKVTATSFTANLTSGNNVLASVSAFTGISEGTSIVGAGIPPLAVVGAMDTVAQTITLTDLTGNPLDVTKTATGESLSAGQGMATYTPLSADTANPGVFNCEFGVHLPGGLLVIPNKVANNPTLTIDAALDLGSE